MEGEERRVGRGEYTSGVRAGESTGSSNEERKRRTELMLWVGWMDRFADGHDERTRGYHGSGECGGDLEDAGGGGCAAYGAVL